MIIAEGDILPLCIRLFSELVLQRYEFPLPNPEESLLARHASALIEENIQLLHSLQCDHRSDAFNSLILPQSQIVIEAIGHALAYTAAIRANLPQPILDIYECSVIRQDPAWYSENAGISRLNQRVREDKAISSMIPQLDTYLVALDVEKYVSAPIVSDAAWKEYLAELPVFVGDAIPEIPQHQAML